MKIVNECTVQLRVARSYDKTADMAFAYVTETKTLFLVTIKICGYAFPAVSEWRVSKKDAHTAIEASYSVANQALIKGVI